MGKWTTTVGVYLIFSVVFLAAIWAASRSVTVLSESAPVAREHCIVIDAGHGGVDGGAVSCTGKPESMYNLEFALILKDLIEFIGYETKMIRTEDISVYTSGSTIAQKKRSDLKNRVQIVKNTPGALLISLHQNNFSEKQYSGAQVFYAQTDGSRILAEQLQSQIVQSLDPKSRRQIKKATGIYLMEHVQCPAVLIECGFLSNPREEHMLRDPDYQKKFCTVVAAGVAGFLSNT